MATYYCVDNTQTELKITRGNGDIYYLPNPQTFEVGIQDIDSASAGRSASGLMFRDRVAVKRKVSCTFPPLTQAQINLTLQAMQDQFFTLEYLDPYQATRKSITAYVGDRTAPICMHIQKTIGQTSIDYKLWKGLNANFVER